MKSTSRKQATLVIKVVYPEPGQENLPLSAEDQQMPEWVPTLLAGLGGVLIGGVINIYVAQKSWKESRRETLGRLHAERKLQVYQEFCQGLNCWPDWRKYDRTGEPTPIDKVYEIQRLFWWAYPFLDKPTCEAFDKHVVAIIDSPDLNYEQLVDATTKVVDVAKTEIDKMKIEIE